MELEKLKELKRLEELVNNLTIKKLTNFPKKSNEWYRVIQVEIEIGDKYIRFLRFSENDEQKHPVILEKLLKTLDIQYEPIQIGTTEVPPLQVSSKTINYIVFGMGFCGIDVEKKEIMFYMKDGSSTYAKKVGNELVDFKLDGEFIDSMGTKYLEKLGWLLIW